MKIDLGESVKYEVVFEGKKYELREPTLADARLVKQAGEGDNIQGFIDFVVALGLPEEVASSLGLSKIKTLTEALMGDIEKK